MSKTKTLRGRCGSCGVGVVYACHAEPYTGTYLMFEKSALGTFLVAEQIASHLRPAQRGGAVAAGNELFVEHQCSTASR